MDSVLITGIAGGKGRLLARRLMDDQRVIGVDRQKWRGHPRAMHIETADLRKRACEQLFRRRRPRVVVHLALVRHFQVSPQERHSINISGTRRLFEHCLRYGVERVVVVSSSTVYGALADNASYLSEEEPLNAALLSPEIRDLVQTDTYCTAQLWQHPKLATVLLRPVNVVGPSVHSVICRYLRMARVPTVMGFDPLFQLIHEEDLVEAVVRAVTTKGLRGVYNVAGPGAVPLSVAIREAGKRRLPVPEALLRLLVDRLFRLKLFPFPAGSIPFIKYPCIVSGRAFQAATGFKCRRSLKQTLTTFR